jgi:hypothetical protein
MGSYLYRAVGKPVDVLLPDQTIEKARIFKFWMKPFYDVWDSVVSGFKVYSDFEKSVARKYRLQLGKLESTLEVRIGILANADEDDGKKIVQPAEGWRAMLWDRPRHYVWDDPNFENAKWGTIQFNGTIWEYIPKKV